MKRNKSYNNEGFILYLIATPIGNLKEFSPRAIEIIKEMDIVAAEDTRNAKQLLANFNIKKEYFSLREHNEVEATEVLIKKIKEGQKVCYMSDAGYPCISDPGNILVKKALENGIKISTISGSSAGINALVASGLDCSHFYFYGFLPSKESDATKEIKTLAAVKNTIILYESPHRIMNTLMLLNKELGNRKIVLARELTKINEEYIHMSLDETSSLEPQTLKGEMVIILEGNKEEQVINYQEIDSRINYFKARGLSQKDIAEVIAYEFKINKNIAKDILNKQK